MAEQLRDIAIAADAHASVRISDVREALDALDSGRPLGGPAMARLCEATGRPYLRTKGDAR